MGARRIGDIAALTGLVAPDIAVVLNVGQAHLGKFGSRAAIARAKGELVQGLAPGGTAVLNADDPRVAAMRPLTDGPVLTFGLAEHADVRVTGLTLDRSGPAVLHATDRRRIGYRHAAAHGRPSGGERVRGRGGGAGGRRTPRRGRGRAGHRLAVQWRLELRELAVGATLLNDSFNANPDSARTALDALAAIEGRRRIAVLGEMLELGDDSEAEHRAVGEYAASRADVVAAVGAAARPIADGAGPRAVTLAGNEAAVDWLRGQLAAGDVVLVKASREARLDEVAPPSRSWWARHVSRVRPSSARKCVGERAWRIDTAPLSWGQNQQCLAATFLRATTPFLPRSYRQQWPDGSALLARIAPTGTTGPVAGVPHVDRVVHGKPIPTIFGAFAGGSQPVTTREGAGCTPAWPRLARRTAFKGRLFRHSR